jgi:hypothetical protein
MGRYLDMARKFDARRAESPAAPLSFSTWPCPHCGNPAEIEGVEPRQDDGVLLTFWHCPPCHTWAVTPATLREPPVWVSRKEQ